MKKVLSFLVVVVMLIQSVSTTQLVNANAAKKPKLNKSSITLEVGSSQTLKVTGTKKKVKWKSAKKSIASVSNKGKVTAKGVGKTTITATVGKKKLNCKITVVDNTISEDGPIDVSKLNKKDVESLETLIKDQKSRGAIVSEDLTDKQYAWYNGKLCEIRWKDCKLSGELLIDGLDNLYYLDVSSTYFFDGVNEGNEEYKDYANNLSKIDVSKIAKLTDLHCFGCGLPALDVSENDKLRNLSCSHNNISELDVSKNVDLLSFVCLDNNLTKLDISKNVKLEILDCSKNQLNQLNVIKNTELKSLDCDDCGLNSLDVSKNTKLEFLSCLGNQLTVLDLSNNSKMNLLWCESSVEVKGYNGDRS